MKKNIYELFSCKNSEELYKKIKQKSATVQELLQAYQYQKTMAHYNETRLTTSEKAFEYLSQLPVPQGTEAWLIFCDSKLRPIYVSKANIKREESFKREIVNGVQAGAESVFLYYREELKQKYYYPYFLSQFGLVQIKVTDQMEYKNNAIGTLPCIYSQQQKMEYLFQNKRGRKKEPFQSVILPDKTEEFLCYYARNEAIGLHIEKDFEKMKELLKISKEQRKQEVLGYLGYDFQGKVYKIEDLFYGGRNATLLDYRIVLSSLFSDNKLQGIVLYHNHPSGDPNPSKEDIEATNHISKICNNFGIEFKDHLVIGKFGVYSFAKENPNCVKPIGEFKNFEEKKELTEVKKAIIQFCNREYDMNLQLNDFEKEYPDLSHVGIAYSETENGLNEIEYELNLIEVTATKKVNGRSVFFKDYFQKTGQRMEAWEQMKEDMNSSSFELLIKHQDLENDRKKTFEEITMN